MSNKMGFITSPGTENGLGNYKDMSDKRAGQLMVEYFSKTDTSAYGGKADGKVSDSDLKAIVRDESQPMEYRQAALKFLKDKPLRNQANQGNEHGKMFSKTEFANIAGSNQTLGNDGKEALGVAQSPAQTPFNRVSQNPAAPKGTPFDRMKPQQPQAANGAGGAGGSQSTGNAGNTQASQGSQGSQGSDSSTNNFLVKLLMMLLPMLLMNK